jgi:hypothetical protein
MNDEELRQLLEKAVPKAIGSDEGAGPFILTNTEDAYVDYERYPSGFGLDGEARTERITYSLEDDAFYATAMHLEVDGEQTFEETSPSSKDFWDCVKWLDANRASLEQAL